MVTMMRMAGEGKDAALLAGDRAAPSLAAAILGEPIFVYNFNYAVLVWVGIVQDTECRCSCLARLARQLSPSSHLQRACDIDMADPSSNSRQWDGRRRRDEEVRGAMHHIMHTS